MRLRKLNNEELAEVLNTRLGELTPEKVFEMFDEILDKLIECNGPRIKEKFSQEEIMAAILLEMYLKGFKDAMVIFNEAYGDCI